MNNFFPYNYSSFAKINLIKCFSNFKIQIKLNFVDRSAEEKVL